MWGVGLFILADWGIIPIIDFLSMVCLFLLKVEMGLSKRSLVIK